MISSFTNTSELCGELPHWNSSSRDEAKLAKLRPAGGKALFTSMPAHAVVLSLDEKSQIQALDRTQPGLPMKKGAAPP